MLLLEDRRYYVYIYLNPLKEGDYNYPIGKRRLHFNYEPFYVGKGCEERLYDHLDEAKSIKEKIEDDSIDLEEEKYNKHKINTINKIIRNGKEPIVFKLLEILSNKEANTWERFHIKLIGRADKKLGPLTNLTDGGEGVVNLSKESLEKSIKKRLQTYEKNPEILINIIEKNRKAHLGKSSWNKGLTTETDDRILIMVENAKKNPNAGMKNKKHSEETKTLYRAQRKNVPKSEEHKKNISIALKNTNKNKGVNRYNYINIDLNILFNLRKNGLSYKKISTILNISYNAVRSRLLNPEKYVK